MEEMKYFQVRIPKKVWSLLKKYAVRHETSMNAVILERLKFLIKKDEKGIDG